eukprot:symbB.v1.2.003360.t1/scaffold186.1/size279346/7
MFAAIFRGRESSTVLSTEQLQRAFQVFEDGNGRISVQSCQKAFSLLFPKHRHFDVEDLSTGLLQRVAEAGDVTCEKFIAMYLEAVKVGGLPGLSDLRDAFRLLDRDKNGTLDLQELLVAFEQCAPSRVPRDEIEALFRSIDVNGDGKIDVEEMIEFLAKTWMESPRWQLRTPLLAESHGRIRRSKCVPSGMCMATAYETCTGREATFTNYTEDFKGTLHYIWLP